jgi:hypothetical protein
MLISGAILGLLSVLFVLGAFAASRDGYRSAYRVWRESDPALERDAGIEGSAVAPRAGKLVDAVTNYGSERSGFLNAFAAEREEKLSWLETPLAEPPSEEPKSVAGQVDAQTAGVKRNIATFANDPDPGIQPLQAALQQENAALASLSAAILDRQRTVGKAKAASEAAEMARIKVLSQERDLVAGLKQSAADTDRQTTAWVEYFKTLSEEVRGISPSSTSTANPAPARSAVSLPLLRYIGAWTFPPNGLFHGPQPEFMDLVVHEENGHATGTLFARFKVPPGSKDDPLVRFDLTGEFKGARTQEFNLETSDGAKGTLQLIPGPAFNLLEINFQTDPKPGKIHEGNAVLVKK